MEDEPTVIATGHTWDLHIEQRMLAAEGVRLIDGRGLGEDDPAWATAAGVLLGTGTKMTATRLERLGAARGVVRYGIGYDNVDVAAAEALGIPVAIIRDYCIEEVAEHAVASALALIRALPHWDRNVRAGKWRTGERPRIQKLASLAFGVVGFGLIGRQAAAKARGLFGRVLVHDPLAQLSEADREAYTFVDTLDEILAEADALTVHVPLVDGTRALLDAAALARMKPSAYVINVSRGGIVDEAALLAAISAGRLAGAALDTFTTEPLPADSPLLAEPKIVLSPHVAWLSEEAEVKLRERASEEMALLIAGRPPTTPVTRVTQRRLPA